MQLKIIGIKLVNWFRYKNRATGHRRSNNLRLLLLKYAEHWETVSICYSVDEWRFGSLLQSRLFSLLFSLKSKARQVETEYRIAVGSSTSSSINLCGQRGLLILEKWGWILIMKEEQIPLVPVGPRFHEGNNRVDNVGGISYVKQWLCKLQGTHTEQS